MTDTTNETERSRMRSLATYPHLVTSVVRFCDTDRLGHVNNTVLPQFVEAGRVGLIDELQPGSNAIRYWVVARLEVDYISELHFPATVITGTRTTRVGRTSWTVESGLFVEQTCIATARSVLVHVRDGKSTPPDAEFSAALHQDLAAAVDTAGTGV
ncbi:MAG: thioesterase family protein [Minwuia sp.]|nr:thioesterase family protein [Minwuia sp.]